MQPFKIKKSHIIGIVTGAIALLLLIMSTALFEDANKSKNYVCQMPVTGAYHVWTDGGLQWQGFGNVESYNKTSQVEFSDLQKDENGYLAVGKNPAAALTFNDKGRGMIVGSFRVVLPVDSQNIRRFSVTLAVKKR